MKISVTKCEKVLISHEESVRIAIETIEQTFGLSDLFLKDGDLYVETCSIHSTIDEKVREATESDKHALMVITQLKDSLS